eukprot:3267009-Prymnesium_polylepis.1
MWHFASERRLLRPILSGSTPSVGHARDRARPKKSIGTRRVRGVRGMRCCRKSCCRVILAEATVCRRRCAVWP